MGQFIFVLRVETEICYSRKRYADRAAREEQSGFYTIGAEFR